MKPSHFLYGLLILFLAFTSIEVSAAEVDSRFLIELHEEEGVTLDIQSATELALPILWQRVVPAKYLEKANGLPTKTSLLLTFKNVKHGVKMEFNPSQVSAYLAKYGITMIPTQPHWNFSVFAIALSDSDEVLSSDLLDYTFGISDEFGFRLGPRGKKIQVIFAPVTDVYGELFVHADVQGSFSKQLLSQTEIKAEGFASIQVQDFLHQILLEIRDAYTLETTIFDETASSVLLTIESELSLSTQVMMEQALSKHPDVVSVVPTLFQKARRQYRIQLRDGNDNWIETWFAGYGLIATRQTEGSVDDWLVQ